MSYLIRPFRTGDLEALKRITVQAFEGVSIERNIEQQFGTIHGHDWRWRKARHIEGDVQKCPEGVFVAEDQGAIIGYITAWIDQEAGVGFIPNLAVDSSARGQGIGRALIEYALHFFHAAGIRHVRIETLEQNPIGRNLYPSAGFVEVARQIHYCMKLPDEMD
jgi:ribosomal protein S18 acetylase RimI-like enzyme